LNGFRYGESNKFRSVKAILMPEINNSFNQQVSAIAHGAGLAGVKFADTATCAATLK
jgi:hypothetical protein